MPRIERSSAMTWDGNVARGNGSITAATSGAFDALPFSLPTRIGQAEGKTVEEMCRTLAIGESTYHRWKNQYGGMKTDEVKRLKELERENERLKKLVAELSLDNQTLKEAARGN